MKNSKPKPEDLEKQYRHRHDAVLGRIAQTLAAQITDYVAGQPRIDRVTARPKSVERFLKKAATRTDQGKLKYPEPLHQIQDQIGARIVVFYKSDVERVDQIVKRYYRAIEFERIVPDKEEEFGYFGHHLILVIPADAIEEGMDKELVPDVFELQIKTLFQHAWSEADHDLGYKPGEKILTSDQKRRIAFTSAQSWGADMIFDELFRERNQ